MEAKGNATWTIGQPAQKKLKNWKASFPLLVHISIYLFMIDGMWEGGTYTEAFSHGSSCKGPVIVRS
jgi:hypothetical protein